MTKTDWNRPYLKTKGKKTAHWHWDEVPADEKAHERMVDRFLKKKVKNEHNKKDKTNV